MLPGAELIGIASRHPGWMASITDTERAMRMAGIRFPPDFDEFE